MKTRRLASILLAGAAFFAVPDAALAQGAGKSANSFLVRARGILVMPQESADISPIGGDADVSNTFDPELDFTYFITDSIAVELIAATTRHSVKAKGTSLGNVDLGEVSLLPPTLTLQYHFWPKQAFSPYVGAGVNYTWFYNAETTSGSAVQSIHYDDGFGAALQIGFDYNLSGNWFFNVDVKQLFLNTDVKLNGGAITADVDLNPTIIGVGIGYKF